MPSFPPSSHTPSFHTSSLPSLFSCFWGKTYHPITQGKKKDYLSQIWRLYNFSGLFLITVGWDFFFCFIWHKTLHRNFKKQKTKNKKQCNKKLMRIYIIFFRCDIQKPISYVLDKLVFTYPILDIVHQPV